MDQINKNGQIWIYIKNLKIARKSPKWRYYTTSINLSIKRNQICRDVHNLGKFIYD